VSLACKSLDGSSCFWTRAACKSTLGRSLLEGCILQGFGGRFTHKEAAARFGMISGAARERRLKRKKPGSAFSV